MAATVAGSAWATPPSVDFNPPPDSYIMSGEDCETAASASSAIEMNFGSGGNCTPGTPCPIAATPIGGSGSSFTDQTILFCSAATLSGDGTVTAQTQPSSVVFIGADPGSATVNVGCAPGSQDTVARACCTENRAGNMVRSFWDVSCPAPASNKPEFSSSPVGGTVFSLSAVVGSSSSANLRVNNTGPGALLVTPGGVSDPVSVAPLPQQLVATGNHVDFTMACTPTQAGTEQQILSLTTNDADENPVDYTVTCTGTGVPAPELNPTPVPPGPLTINTVQPGAGTATLNIGNTGNANLVVSSITGLAPPLSIAPGNATIAPGNTTPFTVTCDGATPGSYGGTFTVNSNDANESAVAFNVNCSVDAPEFDSNPPAPGPLTLAATQGGSAAQATLTVSNLGGSSLLISSITGLSAPLSVSPPNATIAPSGNAVFTVSCATAANGSFNRTMTFNSNDADEPAVAFAVGCGVNPPATPEFNSAPPAPGPLAITTTQGVNGSVNLTVQNIGTASLQVSSITGLSAPFSAAPPSATIATGASQTFVIACSGAAAGSFNNGGVPMVLHTSDADEASVSYSLACQVNAAVAPEYASTPAAPGPLTINTGKGVNATATLKVTNSGSGPLTVSSITGLSAPISVSPSSATIAAGANANFALTCSAANSGTFSRSFTVNTNDADEGAVNYNITCNVAAPPAQFASTPAPGGPTIVVSTSVGIQATSTIHVQNTAAAGANGLTFSSSGLSGSLSVSPSSVSSPGIAAGAARDLILACLPTVAGSTTQTLRLYTNAFNQVAASYTVTCTGLAPEFDSVPAANSVIAINTQRGTNLTSSLRVTNPTAGGGKLQVSASGLSGPLSISPASSTINPPIGQLILGTTFRITCNADVVGNTTRTLLLIHNDSNENPARYTVQCNVAQLQAVTRAIGALLSTREFVDVLFADEYEN